MAKHLESGKHGEERAADYLRAQGYTILAVNWRYKYWEIDIVAREGSTLVFVEVKSRIRTDYGAPEDFVNLKKQKHLIHAAEGYLMRTGYQGEIRFDIVAIVFADPEEITLIRDAFWSN